MDGFDGVLWTFSILSSPFTGIIRQLADAGVEIFARKDDPAIEAYESETANSPELWRQLYRFEMRWPMYQYLDYDSDKIPPRLKAGVQEGAGLTQAEYRAALVQRAHWRNMHDELRGIPQGRPRDRGL